MPYRRQVAFSFGPPLTRMVKWLIIVTSAVFVLTYVPLQIFNSEYFAYPFAWLALRSDDVIHRFYLWELITYLFLHGGWFHIIFNMFALWMFGSDLESRWGGKQFLFYYFLTGIGAGILDVTLNALFHPAAASATIGCSGAVYGLLLAYGMLFPDRLIYLYMIIPIKAKWFVVIMGAIEFVSSFGGSGSGVSHVAHLGGMLFGFLYLRGWSLPYRWQLQYHEWRRALSTRSLPIGPAATPTCRPYCRSCWSRRGCRSGMSRKKAATRTQRNDRTGKGRAINHASRAVRQSFHA